MNETTPAIVLKHFEDLKAGVIPAKNSSLQDRLQLLREFRRGLFSFQNQFVEALSKDFDKPKLESFLTEIMPVEEELHLFQKNLKSWMRTKKRPMALTLPGTRSEVRTEAKGVVLIIAPWNYPVSLALVPLVGALAAGNNVILKPSELTPHVAEALAQFVEKYLPADRVRVIQGGISTSTEVLKLPVDHIFFTGSTQVGRTVMRAAAENLTPVTLELGGKSPVILTPSANLSHAAERLVWGKNMNAGQTCVAPDYVFVHRSQMDSFENELKAQLQKQVPDKNKTASIVSERHAVRLRKLEPTLWGQDELGRKLGLKFVKNPDPSSPLMQEEIFGPILPFLSYDKLDEVFEFINSRPRPLALYVFSEDKKETELCLDKTHSGGVCVNDCLIHLGTHQLPFGGTGESGFGNYHGEASYRCFTQERSVLHQGYLRGMMKMLLPPYREDQISRLKFLAKLKS